jgi:hypothetical protein
MKFNILKIAILILGAIVFINLSCNKSNLDLLPHGPTEQSYFTQESDFTKAVLGIYAKMNDLFWFNGGAGSSTISVFILPGDDITTNNSQKNLSNSVPGTKQWPRKLFLQYMVPVNLQGKCCAAENSGSCRRHIYNTKP